MISNEYIIIDQHGMHARPAAALLKLSRQFRSEVSIRKDGRIVQLKSMLNILSLALKYGDRVSVDIRGEDEDEAARAFENFFIEEMKHF
jgi:phosphocarrier protein